MKSFKYILDSVKEKFDAEEEYEEEGFPDLNYEVGNTSGMDIAPGVPSAIDERIGSLSQRGGSVMEVMVQNPSTFQIDRERMFNVINQLDIDISIHSNPDIGYTSAYRANYDPTHNYFTKYLEQFAVFKRKAEEKAKKDERFGFDIQRINPHISTSPLPSLEEERAGGTGLDPFGYSITDLKEDLMDERDQNDKNIYRNRKFLRRLYRSFVLDSIEGNEHQYFQQVFSDFSDKMDRKWRIVQDGTINRKFDQRSGIREDELKEKATMLGIAAAGDAEVTTEWYDYLGEEFESPIPVTINIPEEPQPTVEEITDLSELDELIRNFSPNYGLSNLRRIPEIYRLLEDQNLNQIIRREIEIDPESQREIYEKLQKPLLKAINSLWKAKKDSDEPLIPVENKRQALARQFEIPQQRIIEESFENNKESLRDSAEDLFAGEDEYFENGTTDPGEQHLRFLQRITQQLQRDMWMESNILYQIIPAWMAVADEEYEGYKKREAPVFLWKALVKHKWGEKGYEIDLTDPRGNDNGEKGFLDLLEENQEFRLDVAAASAACYVWSHFTQREGEFSLDEDIVREKFTENGELEEKYKDRKITWIEWMNEFGIGVNLEAMPGSPQQMYKIWRPKDIVAACRAINITAREELDEINEKLDNMPAKFTIDLEHTATFGVDPWKTMEDLIEQEKGIADSELAKEYSLKIDTEKPLAKVLRMWHLMRAGMETSQAQTLHGPWDRGDKQLYRQLYRMIEAGFARNPDEKAYIMYEVGGDDRGTVYTARVAMNLIELGVDPEDLDPSYVDPGSEYEDEKEALMARFFGMDRATYDQEWTKIEEHAFDPLQGLLEAEQFDYTYSSQAAIENDNRPQEWMQEEYK